MTFLQEAGSEPQAMPSHERAPPEPPLGEAPPAPPDAALMEPPTMDIPEAPALAFPAVPPVESAVAPPEVDVPTPPVPVTKRGAFPQAPNSKQAVYRRATVRWFSMTIIMDHSGPPHAASPKMADNGLR